MRSAKNSFLRRKNSSRCVEALDGRHFVVHEPIKKGSLFFNYKKSFRKNLLAQCNASYKFKAVDIGEGKCNPYCPNRFTDQDAN